MVDSWGLVCSTGTALQRWYVCETWWQTKDQHGGPPHSLCSTSRRRGGSWGWKTWESEKQGDGERRRLRKGWRIKGEDGRRPRRRDQKQEIHWTERLPCVPYKDSGVCVESQQLSVLLLKCTGKQPTAQWLNMVQQQYHSSNKQCYPCGDNSSYLPACHCNRGDGSPMGDCLLSVLGKVSVEDAIYSLCFSTPLHPVDFCNTH